MWSIVIETWCMILDNGAIENAIEFALGRISARIQKKFQLINILMTWCMILDNGVIEDAIEFLLKVLMFEIQKSFSRLLF